MTRARNGLWVGARSGVMRGAEHGQTGPCSACRTHSAVAGSLNATTNVPPSRTSIRTPVSPPTEYSRPFEFRADPLIPHPPKTA